MTRPLLILVVMVAGVGCSSKSSIGDPDSETDVMSDGEDSVEEDVAEDRCGPMEGEPCGPYYAVCPVAPDLFYLEAGPVAHDAAPIRVLLRTTLMDGCWEGGPVIPDVDETTHQVMLTVLAWHLMESECTEETVSYWRDTLLHLTVGTWRVTEPVSGRSQVVEVQPCDQTAAECTCADPIWPVDEFGFECTASCQCASPMECIQYQADSHRWCVQSCSVDEDCWGEGQCTDSLADVGPVQFCHPGSHYCTSDADCPPGHACRTNEDEGTYCRPEMTLSAATRHACSCNDDCEEPGLDCVLQSWPGGSGEPRCNVRCLTRDGMYCGGWHTCGGGALESYDRAVCGWWGE